MFTSDSLIQIVFGYPDDIYFAEGTVQLEFDKYLCLELSKSFDRVYFLKHNANQQPYVCCYGINESKSGGIKTGWLIGKNPNQSAAKWIKKELADGNCKSAVVIDGHDFCTMFDDPDDCKPLTELSQERKSHKNGGSIILTFPPIVEDSIQNLLGSRVFEHIGESGILSLRNGEEVPVFSQLYMKKPGACFFLNVFDRVNIRNILISLMCRYPGRYYCEELLENTVNYLVHYLNNRQLQWCVPIFDRNPPVLIVQKFGQLYSQLENNEIWARLENEVLQCRKLGGYSVYLERKGIPDSAEKRSDLFMTRKPESTAGACLMISPFCGASKSAVEFYASDNMIFLEKICSRLLSPLNTAENGKISKKLEQLQEKAVTVYDGKDCETYHRLLRIMEFITEMLYSSDSDSVSYLCQKYAVFENNLVCSGKYYSSLREVLGNSALNNQSGKSLETIKADFDKSKQSLAESDDELIRLIEQIRNRCVPIADPGSVDIGKIHVPDEIIFGNSSRLV